MKVLKLPMLFRQTFSKWLNNYLFKQLILNPQEEIFKIDPQGVYFYKGQMLGAEVTNKLKGEIEAFNKMFLKEILLDRPRHQASKAIFLQPNPEKITFYSGALWSISMQENIINLITKKNIPIISKYDQTIRSN